MAIKATEEDYKNKCLSNSNFRCRNTDLFGGGEDTYCLKYSRRRLFIGLFGLKLLYQGSFVTPGQLDSSGAPHSSNILFICSGYNRAKVTDQTQDPVCHNGQVCTNMQSSSDIMRFIMSFIQ